MYNLYPLACRGASEEHPFALCTVCFLTAVGPMPHTPAVAPSLSRSTLSYFCFLSSCLVSPSCHLLRLAVMPRRRRVRSCGRPSFCHSTLFFLLPPFSLFCSLFPRISQALDIVSPHHLRIQSSSFRASIAPFLNLLCHTAPIDLRHRKLIPSSRSNRATSLILVFSRNPCTLITTLVRGLLRYSALELRSTR